MTWKKPYEQVLDASNPPFYKWFPAGKSNTCYNCLDLHVEQGRGEQTALIYDSPVTDTVKKFTYSELKARVAKVAGMLKELGVEKGSRVVIYMPMIPEAVIAMLACARLGAIHSVVFGGFAPKELAVRIDDAKPVVILSASCGIEGKKSSSINRCWIRQSSSLHISRAKCVIFQRPQGPAELNGGRDLDWAEMEKKAKPADCVWVKATDPLYILYTSGTTGVPKGVVRDNGGHAVALKWTMKHLYGINPGRSLLGGFRRGLGRGALLHRLCAASFGRNDHHV